MDNNRIKILIADENADFRRACKTNLQALGYTDIEEAVNGEETHFTALIKAIPTSSSPMHGCRN